MSQHYYADGAKHIDKHKEINISLSGTLAGSEDAIAKLSKDFFADDDAEDASFEEVEDEDSNRSDNSELQKEIVLSDADKALHKRLMAYVVNGDWQSPATFDNVRQWISILFGADMKELDAEDVEKTRKFRDFFKGGKAGSNTDRVEVSMANILGYLMSFQLLAGGQKQISIDFFGNDGQVNNINKGKNKDGNQDFKSLLPLMDKYREKIIGG